MRTLFASFVLVVVGCGDSDAPANASADASLDALLDAPPAAVPDLRFKWVDAFPAYQATLRINTLLGGITINHDQRVWAPLELDGAGGDSWELLQFEPTVPVLPMTSRALAGQLADFDTDLQTYLPKAVVTAIDFSSDAYAFTATEADEPDLSLIATGGYVIAADLVGFVAMRAGHGEVTTALGTNGTMIRVAAYSVQGDTRSYETSVVDADLTTIEAQAAALAAGGYTITAIGRTSATAYALVGTRVTGETAAKTTITGSTIGDDSDVEAALQQGYAVVGMYFTGTDSRAILER